VLSSPGLIFRFSSGPDDNAPSPELSEQVRHVHMLIYLGYNVNADCVIHSFIHSFLSNRGEGRGRATSGGAKTIQNEDFL
jgi:hypothetical protein